jgi:hypothetical protein
VPALAGGVRTSGYRAIADRIRRDPAAKDTIEACMSFYGSLYLKPGPPKSGSVITA